MRRMTSRRTARKHALELLYQLDVAYGFSSRDVDAALDRWRQNADEEPDAATTDYVECVVAGVASRLHELDDTILAYARGWALDRMGAIDRALLRLALFEMTERDDIPASVSINEAVELAKRYGDSESAAFVNGILAQIKRDREAGAST
jgi:transcription antitermination protein NusB